MPGKKKPATKKTTAKEAPVTRTVISNSPVREKTPVKTVIAAKMPAKKVVKKAPVKKAAVKKAPAKKIVKKTAPAKKAAKKAPAKKVVKAKAVKKAVEKKPVKKAAAKKPVKKAPVAKAVTAKAAKKPAAKKPAVKKTVKKAVPKKPAAKAPAKKAVIIKAVVKKTVATVKLPAQKKSDMPKDVVELLKAFVDDDFKISKNTLEAAKKLNKGRQVELLAGIDWQSKDSAKAKNLLKSKFKFEAKHIEALEKGLLKGMGGFVKDAKKPLPGPFYDWPTDPPTIFDKLLDAKELLVCEHLKCLYYCCCCCNSCCECCDWPWWRRCRCKYCCCRTVVEVGPTASNTYPHVHRIRFNGAGVSVNGSTATVTINASGGVTMTQVNGAIAEHAANTSNQHAFGTGAGQYAEGNHDHDTTYAAAGHNHAGTYEPVITKNDAFNKSFGTGNTDVARGDHDHNSNYYTQAYLAGNIKMVSDQKIIARNIASTDPLCNARYHLDDYLQGFDIEVSFLNDIITNTFNEPQVIIVIAGYYINTGNNVMYGIKPIIKAMSVHPADSKKLVINCKIYDLLNNYIFDQDPETRPGTANWDTWDLFLNYTICNY